MVAHKAVPLHRVSMSAITMRENGAARELALSV